MGSRIESGLSPVTPRETPQSAGAGEMPVARSRRGAVSSDKPPQETTLKPTLPDFERLAKSTNIGFFDKLSALWSGGRVALKTKNEQAATAITQFARNFDITEDQVRKMLKAEPPTEKELQGLRATVENQRNERQHYAKLAGKMAQIDVLLMNDMTLDNIKQIRSLMNEVDRSIRAFNAS